jgi:antitoxin (DNA-binding transcriptional repressor) of toxin-antitoxin stability system
MPSMSVRDVRQRWPDTERALARHGEVIVTRDGRPVARIVPIAGADRDARAAVDFDALARWRDEFWAKQPPQPSTDGELAASRADRS